LTESIDPGRVAPGPGETGDKTEPNRVFADTKHDRDRSSCSFGRQRGDIAGRRSDYGRLSVDQIDHECWQAIVMTLQPVILDYHAPIGV
jgi:hypothetical protein